MRPRLVATFLLLILAPLSVIAWLGIRMARDEQQKMHRQFEQLLINRLLDIDHTINQVIQKREQALSQIVDFNRMDASDIRERIREQRIVRQIFVLDMQGKMVHPPLDEPRNQEEEAFLQRTKHIWQSGESFFHPDDISDKKSRSNNQQGWHIFYLNRGINLIFWQRHPQKGILGVELDRLALLSDIVGELPQTDSHSSKSRDSRIELLDASAKPIYVWGLYEPPKGASPMVTHQLSPPLGAWRLQYFPAPQVLDQGIGQSFLFSILLGLGALVLAIIGLAIYFIRESNREARLTEQRVTFVNQVSHELKTPLTNIRMYAELLDEQIDEADEKQRSYLKIIVSESQRLSRLINNVLTFGRKQRDKLLIHLTLGRIDETIQSVLDQFRPSLESAGFEIKQRIQVDSTSRFDADMLGQIIGNLLSNVEKYAVEGKWVEISSKRTGSEVMITVADRGPGIPKTAEKKIFEPFVRLSHRLVEGVSGTGIGLSIARDLAHLHGGELVVKSSEKGALFVLTVEAPLQGDQP